MYSSGSFGIFPFTLVSLIYLNLCGLWDQGPNLFIYLFCKLRPHISSQTRRVHFIDSCAGLGELRQISNNKVRINCSEKTSIHLVILCVSFGCIVPRHISIRCSVD